MAVGFFGKQMLKNLVKGGKQKTTGTEVVNPFKFKPSKSKLEKVVRELQIDTAKSKGKTTKILQKMDENIDPVRTNLRQTTQKLAGEPVTKSGFSKGKNIKKTMSNTELKDQADYLNKTGKYKVKKKEKK